MRRGACGTDGNTVTPHRLFGCFLIRPRYTTAARYDNKLEILPMPVPSLRVRCLNDRPPRPEGDYVLYWMTANRRPHWNFSLDRAIELCHEFDRPLLVLEALRMDYPWASVRFHTFIREGMNDHKSHFADAGITYYSYLEPKVQAGRGLVAALAESACAVVSDDYPCFFIPHMLQAAAQRLSVRLEVVDSNGLLPLRATSKVHPTAYDFRRFLQKELPAHLSASPHARPLRQHGLQGARLPAKVLKHWPATDDVKLSDLPINQHVGHATFDGGFQAADRARDRFVKTRLPDYAAERNHPDITVTSQLSPYLHFGNLSAHALFDAVARHEKWDLSALGPKAMGQRQGFWGMSESAEAFLDQMITWRELGYNMSSRNEAYTDYGSLPDWAQRTLAEHVGDPREHTYTLKQLERGETGDPIWNASQNQLVREGQLHNYMRMLWGKNILAWSPTPQEALAIMIELNNKYAVDGRDPNSYSGIFWVLGRYDRPWPSRPVFGKIRCMTSASAHRKLKMDKYLAKYG